MDLMYPASIFFCSFALCLIPCLVTSLKYIKKLYPYILAVSSGFMLGVLLLEFIPHVLEDDMCTEHNVKKSKCESVHHSHAHKEDKQKENIHEDGPEQEKERKEEEHDHNHDHKHDHKHDHAGHVHSFNYGMFTAGITFVLLIAIDTLVLHHSHCDTKELADHSKHDHDSFGTCNTDALKHSTSLAQATILILALSIHSFFEGLVFTPTSTTTIEGSILVHKILESFTLGVTIATSKFKLANRLFLLLFYSALTPFGMVIGRSYTVNSLVKNVFNGLALGSTLFIVCIEMIPPIFHDNSGKSENVKKVLCLGGGFMVTSALFYSIQHSH